MDAFRISLLQMDIVQGDVEANYRHAHNLTVKAMGSAEKPDLIVLPELWNTGYALDRIGVLADENGQRTKSMFGGLCRKFGVMAVAGSVAEGTKNGVRNTSYVINRHGELTAQYSKLHLFGLMREDEALVAGNVLEGVDLEGIPAGVLICYDIRFPEAARSLAVGGAKLLVVAAQWPKARLHHWRTLLCARAIENQMYVAACNRVGSSGHDEFNGHSMIIGPDGAILSEAGEEEEIVSAEISLNRVDEVRRTIPVFRDRRPSMYS